MPAELQAEPGHTGPLLNAWLPDRLAASAAGEPVVHPSIAAQSRGFSQ